MKKILLLSFMMSSFSIFASTVPRYSAFSDGEFLHITILVDKCNSYGLDVRPDYFCQETREIENYATSCSADLFVRATRMFCGAADTPKVFSLKLSETNVAKEAKKLRLRRHNSFIDVSLDGEKKDSEE